MKQLVLKSLAILALVAAIDFCVGAVSRFVCTHLSDKLSQIGTIQQTLLRKTGDVLVLGASCAKYHYDPRILSDSLGLSVQNCGVAGMNMIYSDLVLQAYLERCHPRCVVIDVYGQLDPNEGRLSRIKPFYGISRPVTAYFNSEVGWQQRLKLCSRLYRFNGTLDLFLRHLFNEPNTTNGFAAKPAQISRMDTVVVNRLQLDTAKMRHFQNVISLCRHHEIDLVMVLSPRRYHDIEQEAWIVEQSRRYGIPLINELHEPQYYSGDSLFFDDSHLSGRGAALFSCRVASQLKSLLSSTRKATR